VTWHFVGMELFEEKALDCCYNKTLTRAGTSGDGWGYGFGYGYDKR